MADTCNSSTSFPPPILATPTMQADLASKLLDVRRSTPSVSTESTKRACHTASSFFNAAFQECSPGIKYLFKVPAELKKVVGGNRATRNFLSSCNVTTCNSEDSIFDFQERTYNQEKLDRHDMDHDDQLHRLTSWGTYATFGTEGTGQSTESLNVVGVTDREGVVIYADDDGNPIDPFLLECTRTQMEHIKKLKQKNRRRRLVTFEYPPITSLKECPRTDPEDLSALFFTEEELDMYEDDRRSTFTVDDVEIVAISTSLSDDASPIMKNTTRNPLTQNEGGENSTSLFQNYISTPKSRKNTRSLSDIHSGNSNTSASEKIGRRPSTPIPSNPSRSQQKNRQQIGNHDFPFDEEKSELDAGISVQGSSSVAASVSNSKCKKEKRLLKSVQIYLRERSNGL